MDATPRPGSHSLLMKYCDERNARLGESSLLTSLQETWVRLHDDDDDLFGSFLLPPPKNPLCFNPFRFSMIQKCRVSNEVDAGTVGRKSRGWYIKGCSVQKTKRVLDHRILRVYGWCMLSIFNTTARGQSRYIHSWLNQSHSVVLPASASSISVFRTSF